MRASDTLSIGERLRQERLRLNWSQEQLANVLETSSMSIHRWEHNKTIPQPHYRELLCKVFCTSSEMLFGTSSFRANTVSLPPSLWNVPYRRNPFFTGREEILHKLHTLLHSDKTAPLAQAQALSGLGGIGKTQTVIEYAHRYCGEERCNHDRFDHSQSYKGEQHTAQGLPPRF